MASMDRASRWPTRKTPPGSSIKRNVVARVSMADKKSLRMPRPENVEGNFFVDHTCIDCDTCRWMAPDVFTREGEMSAVTSQPETPETRLAAMQALLSCPTFSIHSKANNKGEVHDAQATFPIPVPGVQDVYHCGFHDEKSFGATSYLVVRPEGNILVDSPRFNPVLLRRIEELGGIKYIFLTHKDDVGDHAKWAEKFGATRLIHKSEVNVQQGTVDCEMQLEGEGPWTLEDGTKDIEFILVPGHSTGSICMFFSSRKILFTGDHMAVSRREGGKLSLLTSYSWRPREQIESTKKLLDLDFLHILPGHGRRHSFKDGTDRVESIKQCIQDTESKL